MKMDIIDRSWARWFAEERIAAWNAHDLDRILALYSEEFEMTLPYIVERMGEPGGVLRGKENVGRYWGKGLGATPPLRFELVDVFVSVRRLALYYKSIGRQETTEVLSFDDQGMVVRGMSYYGAPA